MSAKPFKDHPAFPVPASQSHKGNSGMSMHDYFIAHVPSSLVSGKSPEEAAEIAVEYADNVMFIREDLNCK